MISFSPAHKYESRDQIVFIFVFLAINRDYSRYSGNIYLETKAKELLICMVICIFNIHLFPKRDKIVK